MARRKRVHFPGGFHHVTLRGVAQQDIFFCDEDRVKCMELLADGNDRFDHRIHAFCLMTNHIHLIIQVGVYELSEIMHDFAMRYAMYVNKTHERVGHLFQGRFGSVLMDAECYFVRCVRYVHLNPIRAGLVRRLEDYPWSSHSTYLGLNPLPWVYTGCLFGEFGSREKYCSYLSERLEEDLSIFQKGTQKGTPIPILGDDGFVFSLVQKQLLDEPMDIQLENLVAVVCKQYGCSLDDLTTRGRNLNHVRLRGLLAWLAKRHGSSLTDLGALLKRHPASLSRGHSEIESQRMTNPQLQAELDYLKTLTT